MTQLTLITDTVQRTGTNVLKAGVTLLAATLTSRALRETSRQTLDVLARDIRRIKTEFQDAKIRRLENGHGELI